MVMFHSYVKLPEGKSTKTVSKNITIPLSMGTSSSQIQIDPQGHIDSGLRLLLQFPIFFKQRPQAPEWFSHQIITDYRATPCTWTNEKQSLGTRLPPLKHKPRYTDIPTASYSQYKPSGSIFHHQPSRKKLFRGFMVDVPDFGLDGKSQRFKANSPCCWDLLQPLGKFYLIFSGRLDGCNYHVSISIYKLHWVTLFSFCTSISRPLPHTFKLLQHRRPKKSSEYWNLIQSLES